MSRRIAGHTCPFRYSATLGLLLFQKPDELMKVYATCIHRLDAGCHTSVLIGLTASDIYFVEQLRSQIFITKLIKKKTEKERKSFSNRAQALFIPIFTPHSFSCDEKPRWIPLLLEIIQTRIRSSEE